MPGEKGGTENKGSNFSFTLPLAPEEVNGHPPLMRATINR